MEMVWPIARMVLCTPTTWIHIMVLAPQLSAAMRRTRGEGGWRPHVTTPSHQHAPIHMRVAHMQSHWSPSVLNATGTALHWYQVPSVLFGSVPAYSRTLSPNRWHCGSLPTVA